MNKQSLSKPGRFWLSLLGIMTSVAGVYFAGGGAWLLWLGGSGYFIVAGALLLASGIYLFAGRLAGAVLFAATLIFTAIWALADVGLQFWPLFSRVFTPAVLGMLIAFSVPLLSEKRAVRTTSFALGALLTLGVVASFISAFQPKGIIRNESEISSAPAADTSGNDADAPDWNAWSGDNQGTRFSRLSSISPANVKDLRVAWTVHTGEPANPQTDSADQNTPIQIGDNLYVCTAATSLISYNIDTVKENWRYTAGKGNSIYQRCRGVGYFDGLSAKRVSGDATAPLDTGVSPQRIFYPTGDGRLVAIDIHTGKPAANFGNNGIVDLKENMGEVKPGYYQQSSAPLVAGNLVIVGGRVIDNFETNEPPGVVRAYDAVTGQLVWAWDSGNPDVTRDPLSKEGYTRGSPNVWVGMSYDEKLGMVYLPTGNATPDFYAGTRTPEDDKYGSSVVALNVATGRPVWSYQTVHNDL